MTQAQQAFASYLTGRERAAGEVPADAPRICVAFVEISLLSYDTSAHAMEPGILTPFVVSHIGVKQLDPPTLAKRMRSQELCQPPALKRVAVYPGEICPIIERECMDPQYGDKGFRVVECLNGLNSIKRLNEIQESVLPKSVLYPNDGKKGWRRDFHQRVEAHLEAVLANTDPTHIEHQVAAVMLESARAARMFKETNLRMAAEEVIAGNGIRGYTTRLMQWQAECGFVQDERVKLAAAIPGGREVAPAAALPPINVVIDPAALLASGAIDIDALVAKALDDRGLVAVKKTSRKEGKEI